MTIVLYYNLLLITKDRFREYRWTGPYIVEKVLPNENYIVRKLNSNKTQLLHRIRLRKYELNTVLQDIRPEGNLHPDDEIIIPQDDLYVITWETNFGEFRNSADTHAIPMCQDDLDNSSNLDNDTATQDEIFTDVDLTSTGPHHEKGARAPDNNFTSEDLESPGLHENDNFDMIQETCSDRLNEQIDDPESSGGSDTIVPEVLDDENDVVLVDNKSPRGGKYNLRPNPTANFTDEYRY